MTETQLIYVTYISAKPQHVWNALIQGEFTKQYWGHDNVSDWKPGSRWEHRESDGSRTVKIVGEVVEFDPPRRMVWTWARPEDAMNAAAHSRVTFELEPVDDMVRLTVTHDGLMPGSEMRNKVSQGWPRVLASLKTLLETGKPLPTWAKVAR